MRAIDLGRRLSAPGADAIAQLLDVPASMVLAVWEQARDRSAYRVFVLPGSRRRVVHVPTPLLATLQRRILERILGVGPVSAGAYAGVRGRSAVDAAARHLRPGRHVLKLDVRKAYASTTWGHVAKAYRRRLRTELRVLDLDREERARAAGVLAWLTTVATTGGRRLPLGAPTSVALFNLVWQPLDRALVRLRPQGEKAWLRYTRYVDDLVFSHPARFSEGGVVGVVRTVLRRHRYRVQEGKTESGPAETLSVHGLGLTPRGIEPPRGRVERWAVAILAHAELARDGRLSDEEREASRAWLAGLDGYLAQIYEARGLVRPPELDVEMPRPARRPPLFHLDELWP